MKTLMIFDQLVTLNRERHREHRIDASRIDHGFAAATNSVPIAVDELGEAALHYPCVFIEREGQHALCALLGLAPQQNLFVDADRHWLEGTYVPAFMRRYPFALAETGEASNFLVCVDEACTGLNTKVGEPLFNEAGEETRTLTEAKQFLLTLHQAFTTSNAWCDEVARLGLLEDRVLQFVRPDGSTGQLTGFKAINEERLRQLPPDVAQRWLAQGHLLAAAAHLVSLGQARRLGMMAARAQPAAPAATPSDAKVPQSTDEVAA